MLKFFKRRRPQHRAVAVKALPVTKADMDAAYAWGLTLTQWCSLTDFERRECRRNIVTAPRFQP